MKLNTLAAIVAASLVTTIAHAAETSHTLNLSVEVPATLQFTKPDSKPLDTAHKMTFKPGDGLVPLVLPTMITTNSKDIVNVKLKAPPVLAGARSDKDSLPLKVSLDGKTITTKELGFSVTDMAIKNYQSKELTLKIEAANVADTRYMHADAYTGQVVLELAHATASL